MIFQGFLINGESGPRSRDATGRSRDAAGTHRQALSSWRHVPRRITCDALRSGKGKGTPGHARTPRRTNRTPEPQRQDHARRSHSDFPVGLTPQPPIYVSVVIFAQDSLALAITCRVTRIHSTCHLSGHLDGTKTAGHRHCHTRCP